METDFSPQCNALNVSDEKQCLEIATSVNGLFCSFHSKQCQGIFPETPQTEPRSQHLGAYTKIFHGIQLN